MTKSQLIKKIAERLSLDEKKAKELLECILNGIVEELTEKKRIEMRGFGVFKLERLRGIFVKNPKNGIEMFIGARYTVRFKPSIKLKERLNEDLEPSRKVKKKPNGKLKPYLKKRLNGK